MTSTVSPGPTLPPSTSPWLPAVKKACLLAGSRQSIGTPPPFARQLLPPDPTAAGIARTVLRTAFATHGVECTAFAEIEVVVSELVTNALRHALPANTPRTPEQSPPVRLHLMRWTERLVCAVRDPSHDSPIASDTDDFSAESGRGLFLVDSFSDGWGWHPLAGTLSGKVVWALFRLQPDCLQGNT